MERREVGGDEQGSARSHLIRGFEDRGGFDAADETPSL